MGSRWSRRSRSRSLSICAQHLSARWHSRRNWCGGRDGRAASGRIRIAHVGSTVGALTLQVVSTSARMILMTACSSTLEMRLRRTLSSLRQWSNDDTGTGGRGHDGNTQQSHRSKQQKHSNQQESTRQETQEKTGEREN